MSNYSVLIRAFYNPHNRIFINLETTEPKLLPLKLAYTIKTYLIEHKYNNTII